MSKDYAGSSDTPTAEAVNVCTHGIAISLPCPACKRTVQGHKYDGDKPRLDLLHVPFMVEIGKVLTYGAKKYAPDNWKKVRHGRRRYWGAMLRHLFEWWLDFVSNGVLGSKIDIDTGLPHLAHAGCNLMFIMGYETENIAETPVPCDDKECAYCFPTFKEAA